MVKRILNWNDRRYDELLDSDDRDFVAGVKAFGIGAVEGFIDGAVIIGAAVIAKDLIWCIKHIVKK